MTLTKAMECAGITILFYQHSSDQGLPPAPVTEESSELGVSVSRLEPVIPLDKKHEPTYHQKIENSKERNCELM